MKLNAVSGSRLGTRMRGSAIKDNIGGFSYELFIRGYYCINASWHGSLAEC